MQLIYRKRLWKSYKETEKLRIMETIKQNLLDEWNSLPLVRQPLYEIAGILNGLVYNKEVNEYHFVTARLNVLRRLMLLWSNFVDSEEQIRLTGKYKSGKVTFSISENDVAKISSFTDSMPKRVRNWEWVRGVFGSCGSLYMPKTGYYLTMHPPLALRTAERVQAILRSCAFSFRVKEKAECREFILRDEQQIVTFLSRLGLVKSALNLEETAIYRSLRNKANKLVNCDAANINKSIETAQKQMQIIAKIEKFGLMDKLPDNLKDIAEARKHNPSATLKELGRAVKKPISKSTVQYRWQRLEIFLENTLRG